MKRLLLFTSLIVTTFGLAACNGSHNQTNIEWIQNMFDQISIKSQDTDPAHPDQLAMRTPPEHTLPRGFWRYPYPTDPIAAGKNLVNPLKGDFSAEVLERGKNRFDIYCSACHGLDAKGDGTVAVKMMVKPPNLMQKLVRDFPDGRIFHIITMGQGLMGSYANQIPNPRDRWAVINYVRSLQKQSSERK